MKYIPHTKQDWLRYLPFLLKVYLVIFPIAAAITTIISSSYPRQFRTLFTFQVRAEIEKAHILGSLAILYLVCFVGLSVAVVIQLITRPRQSAISSVLIIAGNIIFWVICISMFGGAK